MTDFIREVDEDFRQDQFKQFFRRFWPVLAGLAVLVLVGVGAWQAYDHFTTEKAQASGGRYLDALDLARDGKTDAAVSALQGVAADGTGGYKLLARMRLAAATGTTDKAEGAKLFDALAADPALDPALKNVARLRAAMLLLDTDSYETLKARLDPLADANSPVRNPARELLALAALKADKTADAGKLLDAIEADPTTTGQLRQRAAALQGLVRGAGPGPVAAAAAPPSAPAPFTPAPSAAATPGAPALPTFAAPGALPVGPVTAETPGAAVPDPAPAPAPTDASPATAPTPAAPETPAAGTPVAPPQAPATDAAPPAPATPEAPAASAPAAPPPPAPDAPASPAPDAPAAK